MDAIEFEIKENIIRLVKFGDSFILKRNKFESFCKILFSLGYEKAATIIQNNSIMIVTEIE